MEIFKIAGTIAVSSQEAEEEMDKTKKKAKETASSMDSSFAKIGSAALKVGKVIASGLAVGSAAIGTLAKSSLENYAAYEQLVGGVGVLFAESKSGAEAFADSIRGSADAIKEFQAANGLLADGVLGPQTMAAIESQYGAIQEVCTDAIDLVMDNAKNAYATVQMSQNDYLQQVNGFAVGLKTALNGDAKAAADLAHKIITAEADIVAATGNSQEAVQNAFNGIMKSNFSMVDNLQLGITPTKEGFQEVIDKVNEWNKANGEATAYQIDNLADCQAALVDYVEMQGLAGYAANEASQTIQGSLAAAKAAWQNLLTGVADGTQNMDSLIDGLVSSVTTAANNIIPRLAQILGGLSTALVQLVPVISAELPGLLGQLLPSLTEGAVGLIGGLVAALPGLVTMLTTSVIPQLLGGVIEISNALIGALPGVIAAIASALPTLLPQLIKGIITMITTLFSNFTAIIQPIIDALPDIIISITEALIENLPALIDGVIAMVMGIVDALPEIIWLLTDMIPQIIEMLVTSLIACTPQLLKGFFLLLLGVIKALPTLLAAPIVGAVEGIISYFTALWEGLSEIFGEVAAWLTENVIDPIVEIFSALWDYIKGVFSDAVALGRKIVNDIKQGISTAWSSLASWFKKLWKNLFGGLTVDVNVDGTLTKPNGNNPTPGTVVEGQYASGLDYVPHDGFIAELHKGEMVVPAAESAAIRNGVFSNVDTSEMTNMLALILEAIREGNEKETVMRLNNREFGRMVKAVT